MMMHALAAGIAIFILSVYTTLEMAFFEYPRGQLLELVGELLTGGPPEDWSQLEDAIMTTLVYVIPDTLVGIVLYAGGVQLFTRLSDKQA